MRSLDERAAAEWPGLVHGHYVLLTISDTGSGMDARTKAQIFEPFFTTKGVGQGTGLGLSQVFGFAKQSGGDIVATNGDKGGASFTLYLPVVEQSVTNPVTVQKSEDAAAGHGLCILVVEDNLEVGEFATQALEELGYRTRWVTSGKEALAELEQPNAFDMVFSDVVMPGMSGIDLGHEVQRLYPDLPFVLTSGYSDAIVQSGASGFPLLKKPYSMAGLSRIIHESSQAWLQVPHTVD